MNDSKPLRTAGRNPRPKSPHGSDDIPPPSRVLDELDPLPPESFLTKDGTDNKEESKRVNDMERYRACEMNAVQVVNTIFPELLVKWPSVHPQETTNLCSKLAMLLSWPWYHLKSLGQTVGRYVNVKKV